MVSARPSNVSLSCLSFFCVFLLTVGSIECSAAPPITLTGASSNQKIPVNSTKNVVFWHFKDMWSGYKLPGRVFMRIVQPGNKDMLWDIDSNDLTPWLPAYVNTLRKLESYVSRDNLLELGNKYSVIANGPRDRYAPTFSQYFSIYKSGKLINEFYVITPAGKNYYAQRFCCESTEPLETLAENFSTTVGLNVEAEKNGKIMLFVAADGAMEAISVELPLTQDVSVDGKAFIFPRAALEKDLNAAGGSLKSRYQVILQHIKLSTPATSTNFGAVIDPKDFFAN